MRLLQVNQGVQWKAFFAVIAWGRAADHVGGVVERRARQARQGCQEGQPDLQATQVPQDTQDTQAQQATQAQQETRVPQDTRVQQETRVRQAPITEQHPATLI